MRTPWERRDTRIVLALAGLAFVVRAVQASFGRVVGADAPQFLLTAMEIVQGDWMSGLRDGTHPVYPLAIIAFRAVLGSFETAGYAAAVVFSSAAMAPYYALVRDAVGRRAAVVATLFFACLPYVIREHSEVMSDGAFHFMYVSALATVWFAVTRGSFALYALAGVVGGIAYLTRPEGVYTPVAAAGLALLALWKRGDVPRWRTAVGGAMVVAIWLAVASPLLLWYRKQNGEWSLTMRQSVSTAMRALQEQPRDSDVRKPGVHRTGWTNAIKNCAWQIGRSTMWIVLVFIVAGMVVARGRIRPLAAAFFACLIVGYLGPPLLAASGGYPFSHRYTLPSILFMLPFAGIAWAWAAEKLPGRYGRIALAGTLGALLTAFVVRAVHPRPEPTVTVHQAADWLKARGMDQRKIHSTNRLIGVYVGKRPKLVPWVRADFESFEAGPGEPVVVFDNHLLWHHGDWREELGRRHEVVATFGGPDLDPITVWMRR